MGNICFRNSEYAAALERMQRRWTGEVSFCPQRLKRHYVVPFGAAGHGRDRVRGPARHAHASALLEESRRPRAGGQPEAGQFLIFPPWVLHGVLPSCATESAAAGGTARVALSFNLLSAEPSASRTDWEVLADASLHMPTE